MASRVFNLDELASRIATHLLAINPTSTVALALTCKALEVPVLRALWGTRGSFKFLIMRLLSTDAWRFIFTGGTDLCLLVSSTFIDIRHPVRILYAYRSRKIHQALNRPLTTWELNRLKRYTSWMRRLDMREWGLSEELTQLVLPPSDGTPPPLPLHLRKLNWWLNETNFSFLARFLTPDLVDIVITTNALNGPGETVESWDNLPSGVVPILCSAIRLFPTSIQRLCLQLGNGPQIHLTEEISAFILRCGETLREFNTNVVLSTQAIVHLMKLPNFGTWVTEQGPPQVTDLIRHGVPDGPFSLFPSLEAVTMSGGPVLRWLPLFGDVEDRTPPWTMAGKGLSAITYSHPTLSLDSFLISMFLPLKALVEVQINTDCLFHTCSSELTDQDVERLAIALPKLEALTLGGWPCSSDTCPTTIRSLLTLSIHCIQLKFLNIHFRMATLRTDVLDMLGYAYSQGLHSKPKCALETLVAQEMQLQLFDYDPALISMGMLMLFPSLTKFVSVHLSPTWTRLESLVKVLGQMNGLAILTEQLMKCLSEARESVDDWAPTRSSVSPRLFFGSTGERGSFY